MYVKYTPALLLGGGGGGVPDGARDISGKQLRLHKTEPEIIRVIWRLKKYI